MPPYHVAGLQAEIGHAKSGIMSDAGRCPICKRDIPSDAASAPFRPFCSERCRLVDLGGWLDGTHRISRPVSEEELDQGVAQDEAETDKAN